MVPTVARVTLPKPCAALRIGARASSSPAPFLPVSGAIASSSARRSFISSSSSPCSSATLNAMFSTPVARYSTTSPTPESAYTPPNARPITMNGLRNSQSTPKTLSASTLFIEASGRPDRHVFVVSFASYLPVFRLSFFSHARVCVSAASTGAIGTQPVRVTTLPPL